MGRNRLDVRLSTLCTEAERAAITLRTADDARTWIKRMGVDPDAEALSLVALADRGRAALLASQLARQRRNRARARGAELAAEALQRQHRAVEVLAALRRLRPALGVEIASLRPFFRLRSPRLEGALSQARIVLDALEGPSGKLLGEPSFVEVRDQVAAAVDPLTAAFIERQHAEAASVVATADANAVRREVMVALDSLRATWRAASAMSEGVLAELVFELAAAELGRDGEGGAEEVDGGAEGVESGAEDGDGESEDEDVGSEDEDGGAEDGNGGSGDGGSGAGDSGAIGPTGSLVYTSDRDLPLHRPGSRRRGPSAWRHGPNSEFHEPGSLATQTGVRLTRTGVRLTRTGVR